MNQVIAKLTESRLILNRYFTNHYENFTEEEKKLIAEIEGNTLPGYYNNNPVPPEIDNNENTSEQIENINKPNIDIMNFSKKNNYGFGNTNNKMRNTGKIMNEEEYTNYQGQLRSRAPPQVSTSQKNQNRFNRNYVGPDDDYWYEKNK